jgi:hypothetical protein
MQSMWSRTRLDRCPGPFELQAVTAKDKTKFLTNLLNRLPVRSAPVRTGVKDVGSSSLLILMANSETRTIYVQHEPQKPGLSAY